MDYELDEFEIEIDGVLVGLFHGSAWLEPDDGQPFHVHRVALAGRRASLERTAIGGLKTRWSSAVLALDRRSRDPLARALFASIAARLEGDSLLQQRFAEHLAAA